MTYYQILGISSNATTAEIKTAYKKLAKQYHPDCNPNNIRAEELFKQINNAHQTLIDENKRKLYDMGLRSHQSQYRTQQQRYGQSNQRQYRQNRTAGNGKVNFQQFLDFHRNRMKNKEFEMDSWDDVFGFFAVVLNEYIKYQRGK